MDERRKKPGIPPGFFYVLYNEFIVTLYQSAVQNWPFA
jgi:hypothetical protein